MTFNIDDAKKIAYEYWQKGHAIVTYKVEGKIKRPLIKWEKWQTEQQTEEEFNNLRWDKANAFGLICGRQQKNKMYLGSIDFDVKGVSAEAIEKGKETLTKCMVTQTEQTPSGGKHFVFFSKKPVKSDKSFHDSHGLELLGKGVIVIMAPSEGYIRLNDNLPSEIDDMTGYFYTLVGKETSSVTGEVRYWFGREDLHTKPYRGKNPVCITTLLRGSEEGLRNEFGIRLCSYFLNFRQNKPSFVQKLMKDWNRKNNPSLSRVELESIMNSTLAKSYVYGCNDPILKKYCKDKPRCPLGAGCLEPLEVVQFTLDQEKAIKLHPLIDYNPETGLVLGTFLEAPSQSLLFVAEKPFIVTDNVLEIEACNPHSISTKQVLWGVLEKRWKRQMLILAREYYTKGKITFPTKNVAFEKVFLKTSHYWYHSDPRWYTFVVCWIIGTYFHVIFTFYPVLNPQGERETGKSTLLELLTQVCWNPTSRECALREADLFRTIEGSRTTYVADITRLHYKSAGYVDVIDVYEAGTEKGARVRRIKNETGEPQQFQIYSPKAIATRYELPFTAKCIRVITVKTNNPQYAKRRALMPFDSEWAEVVNDLLKCTIKYWPEIVEAYGQVEQTEKLNGRPFNYWQPLLAVCKVFSPNRYDKLVELAEEIAILQEKGDRLSEVEEGVLSVLFDHEGQSTTILLKKLTEDTKEVIPWIKDWHIIKSALDNLGITKTRYTTKAGVTYRIDLERAREKAKEKGIEKPTLTQENFQHVFKVLHEECRQKPYATVEELVKATGLGKDVLVNILGELQREGKAIQPRPDMWRLVKQ